MACFNSHIIAEATSRIEAGDGDLRNMLGTSDRSDTVGLYRHVFRRYFEKNSLRAPRTNVR